MIAIATTEDELDGVCHRLRALGVRSMDVVAPGDTRRVVLAAVDDEWSVAGLVVSLRAEGLMAVARPQGGPALQAWLRDTRPDHVRPAAQRLPCVVGARSQGSPGADRAWIRRIRKWPPSHDPAPRRRTPEADRRRRAGPRRRLWKRRSRTLCAQARRSWGGRRRRRAGCCRSGASQRASQRHEPPHGGDARSSGRYRRPVRRCAGEHRQSGNRRAGLGAGLARVAGRMARGERDLAVSVLAGRRLSSPPRRG